MIAGASLSVVNCAPICLHGPQLVPVLAFLEPSLLIKAVERFLSSTEKSQFDSEMTYNVLRGR